MSMITDANRLERQAKIFQTHLDKLQDEITKLKEKLKESEATKSIKRLPEVGELVWVLSDNIWLPRVCIKASIETGNIQCQYVKPKINAKGYMWTNWKFYNEIAFTTKASGE